MALRNPAVILDENLPIHRGQRLGGLKADAPKPSVKGGLQERKALRDVSNAGKALRDVSNKRKALRDVSNTGKALTDVSNIGRPLPASAFKKGTAAKGSVLKEKPSVSNHEATNNAQKIDSSGLTEEEIKMCHEWAKEGVEKAPFTGNDAQKLEKERMDEYVNKEVEEIISALNDWPTQFYFDTALGHMDTAKNFHNEDRDDNATLELWPEVHLEEAPRPRWTSDASVDDLYAQADAYLEELLLNTPPVDFRLRDDEDFTG